MRSDDPEARTELTVDFVIWIVFAVVGAIVFSLLLLERDRRLRAARGPVQMLPTTADPAVLGELRQDAQWWDREFARLEAECFEEVPFDPAEHVGHEVMEWRTIASPADRGWCLECPIPPRRPRHPVIRSPR